MIASEDVRNVTFDKAMRGYRCEDVDDFLKQTADGIDALVAANADLQKKLVVLAQRIDQYRDEEDTLRTTMINAQRLGENVIKEAKQKAAEIIRAANIKAEDREQRARDEVELAHQEVETLKREADAFKKNLLGLYRQHIELLSKIPEYPQQAEPAPEPEPAPAPEPAMPPVQPHYEQPAPQEQEPEEPYEEEPYTDYYGEPQPEQPEAGPEGKVDTVEFAIAPRDEEDGLADPDDGLKDVSGIFGDAPAPKKAAPRKASRGKTPRKGKPQPQEEELPAAFDSFQGVDFNA